MHCLAGVPCRPLVVVTEMGTLTGNDVTHLVQTVAQLDMNLWFTQQYYVLLSLRPCT